MLPILQKHSLLLSALLLLSIVGISLFFPSALPALGSAFFLFTLAVAVASIVEKHKQPENRHFKIAKDVLIFTAALLAIVFLGGVAGLLANYYASLQFGAAAGVVSAIATSFAAGYAVRRAIAKLAAALECA
jgi:Ca2+/Na+ antiporter